MLVLVLGTNAGRGLYHRVLEACARAEDWQAVSLLTKEMEEDKDLPLDADSYLALMDGSTHAKNLSRLQRYANKMRDAVRLVERKTRTPHHTREQLLHGVDGRSVTCCVLCGCAGPVVWVGSLRQPGEHLHVVRQVRPRTLHLQTGTGRRR